MPLSIPKPRGPPGSLSMTRTCYTFHSPVQSQPFSLLPQQMSSSSPAAPPPDTNAYHPAILIYSYPPPLLPSFFSFFMLWPVSLGMLSLFSLLWRFHLSPWIRLVCYPYSVDFCSLLWTLPEASLCSHTPVCNKELPLNHTMQRSCFQFIHHLSYLT